MGSLKGSLDGVRGPEGSACVSDVSPPNRRPQVLSRRWVDNVHAIINNCLLYSFCDKFHRAVSSKLMNDACLSLEPSR